MNSQEIRSDYYVYFYFWPYKVSEKYVKYLGRKNLPFYVGQGCGERIYHHIDEALGLPENRDGYPIDRNNLNIEKIKFINQLLKQGYAENQFTTIHKSNLTKESSLRVESTLIGRIGIRKDNRGPLTNLTYGNEQDLFRDKIYIRSERIFYDPKRKRRVVKGILSAKKMEKLSSNEDYLKDWKSNKRFSSENIFKIFIQAISRKKLIKKYGENSQLQRKQYKDFFGDIVF